jgi:dTDP-4-dehydrorhamnose reductase
MRVLIIGAGGQVGHELMRAAWPTHATVTGLARADLDITDRSAVVSAMRNDPWDLVVNVAAFTAVDRAESERDAAFAVNRDGAANVAQACASRGIPLVHLSTDYVFDGTKAGAYTEDDPIAPLNVYGASKAAGEHAVRASLAEHIIVRTSWVYGARGHNFVKTMLRLGGERDELAIVDDQWGNPTAAADIAAAIVGIAARLRRWGTYHYCGAGTTTWYRLAVRIFELWSPRRRPSLRPIASAEYPTPARRPANSALDCRRIVEAFGVARPRWEDSLARVLAELAPVSEARAP